MTNTNDKSNAGDDAWIAYVILAVIAGIVLLGYGLWLVVGLLAGAAAAAVASRRRIAGKTIAATALVAVVLSATLGATSGPTWVTGFKKTLTTKTASELRQERREARSTARHSGSAYVDPKPTRSLVNLPKLHYGPAFSAYGAQLALLALPVALLTFCGLCWRSELATRKRLEEYQQREREVELDMQRRAEVEDERIRRIMREELGAQRLDDENYGTM